jgi:predicted NAD/FAD-binding protein
MRFLDNHGLLSLRNRPEWRTIEGGSQRYVEAAIAKLRAQIRLGSAVESVQREVDGVLVTTKNGREEFDEVVFAVHSDQVLEILSDATLEEKDVLNAIAYQRNVAVLHTDHRMMPATKRAYASWNYFRSDKQATLTSVTYWMNCLQRLGASRDILVTLNREEEIDPSLVLGTYVYHHPVFDAAAFRAQTKWSSINGVRHTWFCGAYWGYGFHEDGAASALRVARALNGRSK